MKTVCIYHSIDLDGWMSAAIVKHWWIKYNEDRVILDKQTGEREENTMNPDNANSLTFIGYNYGQPIPDLS